MHALNNVFLFGDFFFFFFFEGGGGCDSGGQVFNCVHLSLCLRASVLE